MKSVFTLTALVVFFYAYSQDNYKNITPEHVGVSSDSLLKLNNRLHAFVDDGKLAGIQTVIIRKGEVIHFNSYGFADIKTKKQIDSSSIFRLYSMTKPIVSVALMQLYQQDKFSLEDPIDKYLPEFKNMSVASETGIISKAKNNIKIIDLLRHSSGLGYGSGKNNFVNEQYQNSGLWDSKNNKEFVSKLSKLPLYFEPGTNWEYGVSTSVIGYLIEIISGLPLDKYLEKNVLHPLKMYDTHFQVPNEKINRFTTGYGFDNKENLSVTDTPKNSRYTREVTLFNGGGGLVSTTKDYIKFCGMLLNKGSLNNVVILKPSTVDLMTKDHLRAVKKYTPRLRLLPGETGFGLGFSIASKTKNGEKGVYGWGGLLGTYFRVDPEKDLAYILMIQIYPYRQLKIREEFQKLVNASVME